jgi:hypothetical protein
LEIRSYLSNPATQNSDNEVDNIEKVFIENAPAGTYTIQVTNKGNLEGGAQDFSLIAEGFDSGTLSAVDFEKNDKDCILMQIMKVCSLTCLLHLFLMRL